MDYFTKWPACFAVPETKTTRLANLFVEQIVCRFGVPKELLTDQGKNLVSELMQEVCRLLNVKKLQTTAYHPQCDGMVERFNRTLENMLSAYVSSGQDDWDTLLPYVLFAYRSSVHETTNETPFFLNMERDPTLPLVLPEQADRIYYQDTDDYKHELAENMQKAWDLAETEIDSAQQKQKRYYDRRCASHVFLPGDRVYLHCPIAKKGRTPKLHRPWKGPYRVIRITEDSTGASIVPCANPNRRLPMRVNVQRLKFAPRMVGPTSRRSPGNTDGAEAPSETASMDNEHGDDFLHSVSQGEASGAVTTAKRTAPSRTRQTKQAPSIVEDQIGPARSRYNLRGRPVTAMITVTPGETNLMGTTVCQQNKQTGIQTGTARSTVDTNEPVTGDPDLYQLDIAGLVVIDDWLSCEDESGTSQAEAARLDTTTDLSRSTSAGQQREEKANQPNDRDDSGLQIIPAINMITRQTATSTAGDWKSNPTSGAARFKVFLRPQAATPRNANGNSSEAGTKFSHPPVPHGRSQPALSPGIFIFEESGHPFSPDYKAAFSIENQRFLSVDQCCQYYGYLEMGRHQDACNLMRDCELRGPDAASSKNLRILRSTNLGPLPADVTGIMHMANLHKFFQNSHIRGILAKTADAALIYASCDMFWGCGFQRDDPRISTDAELPGENNLGYILERVRSRLTAPQRTDNIPEATSHDDRSLGQYDMTLPRHIAYRRPQTPLHSGAGDNPQPQYHSCAIEFEDGVPTVTVKIGNAEIGAEIDTSSAQSSVQATWLMQEFGVLGLPPSGAINPLLVAASQSSAASPGFITLPLSIGSGVLSKQFTISDTQRKHVITLGSDVMVESQCLMDFPRSQLYLKAQS